MEIGTYGTCWLKSPVPAPELAHSDNLMEDTDARSLRTQFLAAPFLQVVEGAQHPQHSPVTRDVVHNTGISAMKAIDQTAAGVT